MKRVIVFMISIVMILCLVGCKERHLTFEQTQKNFLLYQGLLQEVADRYNLEMIEEEHDMYCANRNSHRHFKINIDSYVFIRIRVQTSAEDESKTGVEYFGVDYIIEDIESENDFNLPLFVDLVNCISGREISVDFCSEFLNEPEDKDLAEEYGFKKRKRKPLNFFEDWTIYYWVYEYGVGELNFGGLTKQLSE